MFVRATVLIVTVVAALLLVSETPINAAQLHRPPMKLWRLDCGRELIEKVGELVNSCYLIQHGSDYVIWDAGFSIDRLNAPLNPALPISATMSVTLRDQLSRIGVDHVRYVAISHYHFDHVG